MIFRDVQRGCSTAKIQIVHDQPSRSVPAAICIFCAFRYLSKRVPHLAFRGQYYTLHEHNRSSSAISHWFVHIATRNPGNSAYSTAIFRQTRSCDAVFSRQFLFLYTQRSRQWIISRPKFIALTMNFHVRFSAQRAPANDDLARKISLAMIFHASSSLFSQSGCRWNWCSNCIWFGTQDFPIVLMPIRHVAFLARNFPSEIYFSRPHSREFATLEERARRLFEH